MIHKILSTAQLTDLVARVPPNQAKQFRAFMRNVKEYRRRVHKYPDKLPKIDWDFYRANVRKDFVEMVEQFRIKYEELSHVFDSRHEVLDHRKYYADLDKLTAQVEDEVKRFKDASNARISIYANELRRIKNLIPYEKMTMEQFVCEREDVSHFIPGQGKPLFWPHDEAEQCIGPVGVCEAVALKGTTKPKKNGEKGVEGEKGDKETKNINDNEEKK